jgi:gas vesicle protein
MGNMGSCNNRRGNTSNADNEGKREMMEYIAESRISKELFDYVADQDDEYIDCFKNYFEDNQCETWDDIDAFEREYEEYIPVWAYA